MQEITSRQNKNLKIWLQCLESKGILNHQLAILAGKKVIEESFLHHQSRCVAILIPQEFKLDLLTKQILSRAKNTEVFVLSKEIFKELDVYGTHGPLLLVAVPEIRDWGGASERQTQGCILWLTFQDPRNVGAVLRSASAFGVQKIVLGPGCAHPWHPASSRAASGGLWGLEFFKSKDLPGAEIPTVALDMKGRTLSKFKFPKNFILMPGTEGAGVDQSYDPTHRVTIPMTKRIESLNAATATSIALYEWSKTLGLGA